MIWEALSLSPAVGLEEVNAAISSGCNARTAGMMPMLAGEERRARQCWMETLVYKLFLQSVKLEIIRSRLGGCLEHE